MTTLRAALIQLFPAKNSVENAQLNDVIGNKTDDAVTTVGLVASIIAYIKGLLNNQEIEMDHIHSAAKVYPSLAVGKTVTAAATPAWTLGNYSEIVPINTITGPFDIHGLKVEGYNTTGTYCLVLYAGTVEIGRARITRDTNVPGSTPFVPFMTPLIPANTQIQAKVAHSTAAAATITFSIMYHTY